MVPKDSKKFPKTALLAPFSLQSVVHQVLLKMEGWHAYPQKVIKLIFYPLGMPISLQLVFYPLKFCQAA